MSGLYLPEVLFGEVFEFLTKIKLCTVQYLYTLIFMQLTKSLCRRIAAGVLMFSAILHVVYFALVVSGAVEDTRSSPTNNAMVVITIVFFISSSLYIVWKSGGNIWLPLFVTIVNFLFTLMIIALLMNPPMVAPVAWLVVWLFTDFACFATNFWLCWVERSKFPCVKGSEQYSEQDEADVAAA